MNDFFNLTRGRVIEVLQFLSVHVRPDAHQHSRERRELAKWSTTCATTSRG